MLKASPTSSCCYAAVEAAKPTALEANCTPCVPRKVVNMLAPLLRGPASPSAAKGAAASNPAPTTPTQQLGSVAPAGSPSPSSAAAAAAAVAALAPATSVAAAMSPGTPQKPPAVAVNRASYLPAPIPSRQAPSGAASAQKRSPLAPSPRVAAAVQYPPSRRMLRQMHAQISLRMLRVAAPPVPHKLVDMLAPLLQGPASPSAAKGAAASMVVFPALGSLLEAARNCALPPSCSMPEAGTPNYPTSMLALSSMMPPRMARPVWCLADYTVLKKLYKGYASTVYKATCKTSGDAVVLKVYTLADLCDLFKYQIYREVRIYNFTFVSQRAC